MIRRGGEVVIRMLENVQQVTIRPLIERTIAKGATVYTDEYDIYGRLVEWGYGHETVCHAKGEYARDDDGDGFCEVHVNTMEGFWSLLRSWLRPHRGIPQESLPLYLGFFEFVHNVRARGRRLLGALIAQLLAPPCNRWCLALTCIFLLLNFQRKQPAQVMGTSIFTSRDGPHDPDRTLLLPEFPMPPGRRPRR
jgi:transposase-like protein